ncbi:MAG: AraC family transcriptional regulator [Akkermansiaceae bacterium]|jgi:AraC-like DNA-binding protein|nr:AraC family transcriptional regulator [Akkermansiaceae bacterium]
MLNFYEGVRDDPSYNKLEIGDLLFAEYTCGLSDGKLGLWTHSDYLVHVVSGRKTWHTADGTWEAKPGETLFFKKGVAIVEQHFEVDFCLLIFFIPDDFVRSTVREIAGSLAATPAGTAVIQSAVRVDSDVALSAFFQSMRTYLAGKEKPSELLVRLKLKELIVGILTSGRNPALAAYFRRVGEGTLPSVAETMETHFRFNLSLEEYARLCHRSLSSFKRDFQNHFQEAPGKWLLRKRLDHAAALLRASKLNVTEIAFESGFEDVSHFSRVFKERFHLPPLSYRRAGPSGE